jgi:murein L,D-transpeptidase YafK
MNIPSEPLRRLFLRASRLGAVAALAGLVAACQDTGDLRNYRAYAPIAPETVALMQQKGSDSHAPILLRAYKKEAELEIWKMRTDGKYTLLKTYPMCRWSGQLGPKVREGDRQVPEGFYTITPGQMNPNSAYYLSFNVGYPNAYDKAHGYTGGAIMVHGICSSAGCFSMTNEQIAEIYAIAREAFGGGQRAIQMQSLPFRMTPENLAKYRFDPNMKFWKELKEGTDQFDVSHEETKVAVCGRRYVFGASSTTGHIDPSAACPPMSVDSDLKAAVAEKEQHDSVEVADLVAKGVKAIRTVYADGGQNPQFANRVADASRQEALDTTPVEIAIDEHGKPIPAVVQMAAKSQPARLKTAATKATKPEQTEVAKTDDTKTGNAKVPTEVAAAAPSAPAAASGQSKPFYKRLLSFGPDESKPAEVPAPAPVAAPVETSLPPKRPATPKRQAQQTPAKPQPAAKPQASRAPTGRPVVMAGAQTPLSSTFGHFTPAR